MALDILKDLHKVVEVFYSNQEKYEIIEIFNEYIFKFFSYKFKPSQLRL